MMKPDPKIRAIPRPVRVAYLLEDGTDAHSWLDAVFADCFGRHGGRQSLIVPVTNSRISERYREWLRVLDPDFVVALTYDNEALIPGLVEVLADTTILEHKRKRDEIENHPRISSDVRGLTSLSWLPVLKISSGVFRARPEFILDCHPTWEDDGLIKDNFGTLYDSLGGFPAHPEIADHVRPLMLMSTNAPEQHWLVLAPGAEDLEDAYEVPERLSKTGGRTITLAHLSNLNCQPHRPDHPWREGFCLVVGDSLEDRLSCWNAGLLFDDAQTQVYKTLRVPAATRKDNSRTARIGNFLRQSNWIGQNNSPARLIVRSHSLSANDLEKFVSELQKLTMSYVEFQAIHSTDDCCPDKTRDVFGAYHLRRTEPTIGETAIRDDATFLTVPSPMHLSYCVGLHPLMSHGPWYMDLEVDRLNDNSRYDNVREVWTLPMRPQLVKEFYTGSHARILRRGDISVQVDVSKQTIEIRQPDEDDLFSRLLRTMPDFSYSDLRKHLPKQVSYKYSEPSDKGRYLRGVIGMFGSLNSSAQVLGSHFWRSAFSKMAVPAEDQYQEIIVKLKKRLTGKIGKLNVESDEEWKRLARLIIQLSGDLRIPRHTTTLQKLSKEWELELEAAIKADPHLYEECGEILQDRLPMLKQSIAGLCDMGVFHRGHEWVCRYCSHRNWASVGSLKNTIPCDVCRKDHALPVDLNLDFRLNEFFSMCLREHDTLTMIWALSELQGESKRSFIFAPQTALFRDYHARPRSPPDRELDIFCIVDGALTLGEAKANVSMISAGEIETLAAVAQELEPDVVVLAALLGDRAMLDKKVAELRKLIPARVEAKGILSDWNDEPSFYLP